MNHVFGKIDLFNTPKAVHLLFVHDPCIHVLDWKHGVEVCHTSTKEMFLCSINMALEERYDVIVLVHLHGAYELSKSEVCEVVPIPKDKHVTFLEAVPCGVRNITNTAWYDYTRGLLNSFIGIFGPTKELAVQSQKVLRDIKHHELENEKSGMNTLLKEMTHDGLAEKASVFKEIPGWEIRSLHEYYANREYEPDPTWPMHMIVVYTEYASLPLNTNLSSVVQKPFSRKTLLDYLYEQGAIHPLIIDNSCGDVYANSPTGERYAVRESKKAEKGGTRRKKSKRKSMKRPKV